MANFLDYRASIGSTTFGNPGTLLSTSALNPSYIGSIGLVVGSSTDVRVELQGQLGVAATLAPATVTLFIVRNATNPTQPGGGATVFTSNYTLDSTTAKSIAINAADLNPPVGPLTPGQVSYSLFAYNSAGGSVVRTGPENFEGFAAV